MEVTIHQIAQNAGVSKSTVSRVLNGLPVKNGIALKVKDVIKNMDYRPNGFPRGWAMAGPVLGGS